MHVIRTGLFRLRVLLTELAQAVLLYRPGAHSYNLCLYAPLSVQLFLYHNLVKARGAHPRSLPLWPSAVPLNTRAMIKTVT